MGVTAGVPNLLLAVARPRLGSGPGPDGSGWYHGLHIELKKPGERKPEGQQEEFLEDVIAAE
jgi:hypothetical protein